MIVNGGYLNPALDKPLHYGADLGVGEYQITHDHGAIARRLKRQPRTERERRFDRHSIDGHMQIRAWQAVLVHASRLVRSLLADRFIDLRPVNVASSHGGTQGKSRQASNPWRDSFHFESSERVCINSL